jgi:hypothetical protein
MGRLSSAVEAGLVGAIDREDIAQWEWAAVQEFATLGRPEVLVVRSIEAIAPVFDAMRCLADRPEVIASAELPPDAVLSDVPVAGD